MPWMHPPFLLFFLCRHGFCNEQMCPEQMSKDTDSDSERTLGVGGCRLNTTNVSGASVNTQMATSNPLINPPVHHTRKAERVRRLKRRTIPGFACYATRVHAGGQHTDDMGTSSLILEEGGECPTCDYSHLHHLLEPLCKKTPLGAPVNQPQRHKTLGW